MFPSVHKYMKENSCIFILSVLSILSRGICQDEEQASCSSDEVTERGQVVYRCSEVSIDEGQSTLLPCIVRRPAVTCHWFRGVQLLNLANSTKYRLPGRAVEGDCSLQLTNVTAEEDDDAWFSCIPLVINRHPKFDFRIKVLVKPEAPYIIFQNKTLENGTTVLLTDKDTTTATLTCVSKGGHPPPEIHWIVNGEFVSECSSIVSNGSDKNVTSNLEIQLGTSKKSDGDFKKNIQCVLRHPTLEPNDQHWAQLDLQVQRAVSRVYLRSELSNDDGNIVLAKNTYVVLTCDADGHPPPSYIFKSRVGNTWREVKVEKQGAITVRRAGEFKCLAHNELNGNIWVVSNNSVIVTTNGLSFSLPETHLELNGIRLDSFSSVQLQLDKGQKHIAVHIQCVSRHVPLAFHNHHLWFLDGKPTEAKKMEADVDPDWPNSWRLKSYLQTNLQADPDGVSVECILNDQQAAGSYGSHYRAGVVIHVAKEI